MFFSFKSKVHDSTLRTEANKFRVLSDNKKYDNFLNIEIWKWNWYFHSWKHAPFVKWIKVSNFRFYWKEIEKKKKETNIQTKNPKNTYQGLNLLHLLMLIVLHVKSFLNWAVVLCTTQTRVCPLHSYNVQMKNKASIHSTQIPVVYIS